MLPQITHPSQPIPLPDVAVNIRLATLADLPFIDGLQKKQSKQVGWMPTQQLEEKIVAGNVLVAVDRGPVGYIIAQDQYFKRDDVGIIYQINVVPEARRSFIAAALLKAQFDRSAYGCKLYCCWCAQDIEANKFWEAMGFVPLAFRAGSEKKSRVHIFWQKRIRAGDATTPWWFPSKTNSGAIREDRIVLPIPPGTHWSDAKPLILPAKQPKQLPVEKADVRSNRKSQIANPKSPDRSAIAQRSIRSGGLRMILAAQPAEEPPQRKPKPNPKPKRKTDPKLAAAARELRDRWLEQVNATPILPSGKYEVSRLIDDTTPKQQSLPMLAA